MTHIHRPAATEQPALNHLPDDPRSRRLRNLGTSISAEDRRARRTEKREVFARFLTAASTAQMAAARYRFHYDPGNPQGTWPRNSPLSPWPRLIVSSSWSHPGSH